MWSTTASRQSLSMAMSSRSMGVMNALTRASEISWFFSSAVCSISCIAFTASSILEGSKLRMISSSRRAASQAAWAQTEKLSQ